MKFLNGFKTITGTGGMLATFLLSQFAPDIAPAIAPVVESVNQVAYGIFGALAGLGVVHKVEKSTTSQRGF